MTRNLPRLVGEAETIIQFVIWLIKKKKILINLSALKEKRITLVYVTFIGFAGLKCKVFCMLIIVGLSPCTKF